MIYVVGIGPGGDVGYLTMKAVKAIEDADEGIYIGQMIGEQFKHLFNGKRFLSGDISKAEVLSILESAYTQNRTIVLLMPGDSSFYSGQYLEQFSLNEYVEEFKRLNYKFEIIPGISALNAICAISKLDLTSFTNSQNIFITSIERLRDTAQFNQTELKKLLSTKPNLILYQSYRDWEFIKKLVTLSYAPTTKIIFAYKISWNDEQIIESTLNKVDSELKNIALHKHTIILIIPEL